MHAQKATLLKAARLLMLMRLTLGQGEPAGAGGQVTSADRNRALRNREPNLAHQVSVEVPSKRREDHHG